MIAPVALRFVSLIALLGLGGGVGLPLGVPPLPEDPLLAKVAPEECLFYTSWAGTATPDPKSANQTEQLLAEPEVQQMIAEIERHIRASLREHAAARNDTQAAALLDDVASGVKTLGVFGPTDPRRFGPYPLNSPSNHVVQAPVGDLRLLTAKDVYARFARLDAISHGQSPPGSASPWPRRMAP